jgi:bifunctional pyridoxal-dependent enzyme with beta-cystathionase and maltose regulon repressor activities
MDGQLSKETREWLSEVLPEVLRDEDVILRLVERGLLWLEWNPTDKNYLVWMSKRGEGDRFAPRWTTSQFRPAEGLAQQALYWAG